MKPRHAAALALVGWKALQFPEKAALAGAFLGFLSPQIVHAILRSSPSLLGAWIFWLWPSVVLLIVFGVPAPVANMHLVYAISLAINILLYALLFWFATILFDTAKRL